MINGGDLREIKEAVREVLYEVNSVMTKNEFINRRTKIISRMLDNPDEHDIYPTTICFAELDDLYDELTKSTKTSSERGKSWAQINKTLDKDQEV